MKPGDGGTLHAFLAGQRPIAFYPILARIGGSVNAGVFLSQLLYWTPRGYSEAGWVYKSMREWSDETMLTRKELDRVRGRWHALGILRERTGVGTDRTISYRIDFAALNRRVSEDAIAPIGQLHRADQAHATSQSDSCNEPIGALFYTETTTETTTERGRNAPSPSSSGLPKGLGPIIDAFRERGVNPPNLGSPQLQKAGADLLRAGIDPVEIASLYADILSGAWGDDFTRRRLSLSEVPKMLDGYRAWVRSGKREWAGSAASKQSARSRGAKGYQGADSDVEKYNRMGSPPRKRSGTVPGPGPDGGDR